MSARGIQPGTLVEATTAYGVEVATFVRVDGGLVYLDRKDGSRYRTEAIRIRAVSA